MENAETVTALFEDIKTEMCEDYCRYPREWDGEAEGCELYESEICANCPLMKL